MRQESKTISGTSYTLHYPSEVCLAYNYNSIKIESSDNDAFKYFIGFSAGALSFQLDAASFEGNAEIYISKVLQLFFTDIPTTRNKSIGVYVHRGDTLITNFTLNVLYASLSIGERMGAIGAFAKGAEEHYERHITWFSNFPFRASTFALADATIATRHDDTAYVDTGMSVESTGIVDFTLTPSQKTTIADTYIIKYTADVATSVFDTTYDFTFFQLGTKDTRIVCKRCDDTDGYFFRWIDRRGYWMQYLFVKGKNDLKTPQAGVSKPVIQKLNGMQFETERRTAIEAKRTIKCGAASLDDEHFADVSSIAAACYVDLFMGYDSSGAALWMPVTISAATHTKDEQTALNDIEISFELNETTQQL